MRNRMHHVIVVAAIAGLVVSASHGQAPGDTLSLNRYRSEAGRRTPATDQAESLSQAFRAAANTILPSVVKIRTTSKGEGGVIFRGFGIPIEAPDQEGLGSGVVIDSSGIILTNNHVVKNADEVIVEFRDGTELNATEYTTDPLTDLAIIRVYPESPLPAAKFGDSDALQIGDWVLAVGHPLELDTSVSAGIISAKGRTLGSKVPRAQFLQTDAAINPGNSGGPLVNLRGEIVGINTAIASQTGGYQGIGFAVPGNLARDVERQLVANGEVRRGYLGVTIQELDRELARQFLDRSDGGGVVVNDVVEGTPAASAGVKAGDVITHFANQPVDSPAALQRAVERVPVGSAHQVRLVRFGRPLELKIRTLAYSRERISSELRGQTRRLAPPTQSDSSLGFEIDSLRQLARQRGIETNDAVVVTRVARGGLAAQEGLRPGMIILQVRDRPTPTVEEFMSALRDESLSRGVLLLVRDTSQGGVDRFVVLRAKN